MPEEERQPRLAVNPPVFFVSAGLLVAFLAFGVFATDTAARVLPALLDAVSTHFGWLYVLVVAFLILFGLGILFSRYAEIRLGDDSDRPEFGTLTWFSMLFSAGMGIGMVFYGVAEPMQHFSAPPTGEPRSLQAAAQALPVTYFHWGIHAWAIYALMGLGIAYFAFRRKLPLAVRSCFYPLLGERVHGPIGHVIDVLAVLGTLFGLATSLGLGAMQVSAGLSYLFDVPHTTRTQLLIIAVITLAATVSLVTGVKKGIRRLSEANMLLAGLLLVFVFLVGPTGFLVDSFVENIGGYLQQIFTRTFRLGTLSGAQSDWAKSWTLFYWGWWISWSPFVGMFIARISRGRTIREFLLGVLLVPTGVSFVWFTVFGGTALWLELHGGGGIADAVSADVSTAIYVVLGRLPLAGLTSLLAAGVVAVFFVTSSDSASFVVDMLTSGGHPDPPVWQRVFWAVSEGACAAVLLYAGGAQALSALQAGVISIGLPFSVVLVVLALSLLRGLRDDPAVRTREPLVGRPVPMRLPPEGMPMQLARILVPVDYSDYSRNAVIHAVELAGLTEESPRIDVLHVAVRPAEYLPLDEWIWGEEKDQHTIDQAVSEAAQQAFDAFLEGLPESVRERVTPRLELGVAWKTILRVAEKEGYDLIVMGTHGRTGAERLMLGSVAERVLRHAACPVVTVR